MHEFNNRISAQRQILQIVNRKKWKKEDLFGLSSKAIERWLSVNQIDADSHLAQLIRNAAAKLFFLANKSQEQISEEYKLMSEELSALSKAIENIIAH